MFIRWQLLGQVGITSTKLFHLLNGVLTDIFRSGLLLGQSHFLATVCVVRTFHSIQRPFCSSCCVWLLVELTFVCESSLVLIILLNAICCLLSLVVIYLFIYIFDFHQHSVGLVLCQYLTFARSTQLALVRIYPITSLFFIGFHSLMILEHHKLR